MAHMARILSMYATFAAARASSSLLAADVRAATIIRHSGSLADISNDIVIIEVNAVNCRIACFWDYFNNWGVQVLEVSNRALLHSQVSHK